MPEQTPRLLIGVIQGAIEFKERHSKTDRTPNVSAWMVNDPESDFDAAPESPLIL